MKCLIVDDKESVILGFRTILEVFGHKVIVASSQIEGIEMIMYNPDIDFVITDNDMPIDNQGLEVVRQARIQLPKAIIWMASGRMDKKLRNTAKAFGANEGYEKPSEIIEKLMAFAKSNEYVMVH
jgi:CheY-like chemotaxis protein